MNVAITAASGQLGSEIVKATAAIVSPENVVGLARTPANASHLGVEIRPGDYDQPDVLAASLQGVDAVLDVRDSGLEWVIGGNGIYIEPDIEYIDQYVAAGGITNCAGNGRCGYTTRPELAYACARMLTDDRHDGRTYNLHGEAITQYELADRLNRAFGTDLTYMPVSVEKYRQDRIAGLSEFIGTVLAGIYEGIRNDEADNPSHYTEAAGREHVTWSAYFAELAEQRTKS